MGRGCLGRHTRPPLQGRWHPGNFPITAHWLSLPPGWSQPRDTQTGCHPFSVYPLYVLPLQSLPTVTFNKGQARRNGMAQKQRGLGVGWLGACLELVRAGTPCQDKVRSCPPLTAHPIWPRSALPTRRASRRLKITEASLY